jgi:DNA-binding PadR family transcriptional regulator
MQSDRTELDGQVLATLRAPTLSGATAIMSPKRISHHIGYFLTGTGWGPSPQAVTASLRRLAARGLVERAGRSRTCWTITRGKRDS